MCVRACVRQPLHLGLAIFWGTHTCAGAFRRGACSVLQFILKNTIASHAYRVPLLSSISAPKEEFLLSSKPNTLYDECNEYLLQVISSVVKIQLCNNIINNHNNHNNQRVLVIIIIIIIIICTETKYSRLLLAKRICAL
jgi:hypothetical protein